MGGEEEGSVEVRVVRFDSSVEKVVAGEGGRREVEAIGGRGGERDGVWVKRGGSSPISPVRVFPDRKVLRSTGLAFVHATSFLNRMGRPRWILVALCWKAASLLGESLATGFLGEGAGKTFWGRGILDEAEGR